MPDLHHLGYASNKQCFRSTTEVSSICDKCFSAVLVLSAYGMLFSSEEECSKRKDVWHF